MSSKSSKSKNGNPEIRETEESSSPGESAPSAGTILICDDDELMRRYLKYALGKLTVGHGKYQLLEAANGEEAKARITEEVDVVLLDINMPGASGLDCLDYFTSHYPQAAVIMLSSVKELDTVVEAMSRGAFWYLTKDLKDNELQTLVERAIDHGKLLRENTQLKQAMVPARIPKQVVGNSTAIKELVDRSQKVAQLDSTVLITGESGTGKSMFAKVIHESGPRADKPFVVVSCACLPRDLLEAELFGHERGAFTGAVNSRPGRFEMADGGTIFLDEIGDLPLELQPKLLVFLQERTTQRLGSNQLRHPDVRVIAATNVDLKQKCDEKRFREDLYFRLNVLHLEVPPLREHSEDIELLANNYLNHVASRRGVPAYQLSKDAIEAILNHNWPGNIRELENALERGSAFCNNSVVTASDLGLTQNQARTPSTPSTSTGSSGPSSSAGMTLEEIERQAIIDCYVACEGNKAAVARTLGVSEKSIYNKIKRLKLEEELEAAIRL